MINYEYLNYWTETMLEIAKTEQNMKNDLDNYMQTKKITHIESLNKNIEKLLLLKTLAKENYNLAFNQQ